MAVTIELKPEIEARAVKQATTRGLPVENFLEFIIEESLNGEEGKFSYQTLEEWEAALDEFANSPAFARAANRFVEDSREAYLLG
jgi:hypothetical protein